MEAREYGVTHFKINGGCACGRYWPCHVRSASITQTTTGSSNCVIVSKGNHFGYVEYSKSFRQNDKGT